MKNFPNFLPCGETHAVLSGAANPCGHPPDAAASALDHISVLTAGLPTLKAQVRPVLYNSTLAEIEVLASPLDRAQALTWSELDLADERTRALIRSVRCPEAGELGAALQRLLEPVTKPDPRPRRKPAVKPIPEAVRRETRGNLFEMLADEVMASEATRTGAKAVGAEEVGVPSGTDVPAPVTKVPVVPFALEAELTGPDGEPAPGPDHRVVMPLAPDAGASPMNLAARLRAVFAGRGAEPAPSR
ncbi:MAG: hypothetical protein WAP03_27505 [Methylorubrum rhodinum]|uniref:hypothetical protein n=1 Tax=Methylorubrum rhodinum TaxID=29428 RepID=UPI003BAF01EE